MTPTSIDNSESKMKIINTFTTQIPNDYIDLYYQHIRSLLKEKKLYDSIDQMGRIILKKPNKGDKYENKEDNIKYLTGKPLSESFNISVDTKKRLERIPQVKFIESESESESDSGHKLYVHDYVEEGIKVNWKKAKELYDRIKRYESDSI